ncbi:1-aminocyclopropane-1-carboxylate oxidase homolog 7-like [Papaver somniferum]|uniref:1-aminocyclopropane-1-carboxylate oxidase homolog 7-like n=1 Tax=Papaver somniferum TaxID=3469 RepID=UPI000E6FAC84|nr:1-aminocyclopropane-1-carboxylate oxidase homolog 7-like [Papaver somniferum]
MGAHKHTDPNFFTLLLQDNIGGLQILYQNHWIDVKPIPGAIVVNIGDLIQLMSSAKFKSAEHRVLANRVGPRLSVASFFGTAAMNSSKINGPIKELLSEEDGKDLPVYRNVTVPEYMKHYYSKGSDGVHALSLFKL